MLGKGAPWFVALTLLGCPAADDGPAADTSGASSQGDDGQGSMTAPADGLDDGVDDGLDDGTTSSTDPTGSSSADDSQTAGDDSSGDTGATYDGLPLYDDAIAITVDLPQLGDPTDIYRPDADGAFPVALLLQGANVDKQYYSDLGHMVARYGFIVVVPNHESSGVGGTGLFMEQGVVVDALAGVAMLGEDPRSALSGRVDASLAGLMGHSYGGVVGVYALTGQCQFPFCAAPFTLPAAIKAGAFYGTNMRSPFGGDIAPLANEGRGIALIQGTVDAAAAPNDGLATYEAISSPPAAYVSVLGANHYGNCDVDDPPGAAAETAEPTLDQAVAVDTVGRFSGLFLRAWVLQDAAAADYLTVAADPNAVVMLLE